MKKLNSSLLLVAACTALVLAGCNQKPAQNAAMKDSTAKNDSQNVSGSIKIEESKDKAVNGSITIVDPTKTDATTAAATKAMEDAKLAISANSSASSAAATKAMEDANKAMAESTAAANAAMKDAKAAMATVPSTKTTMTTTTTTTTKTPTTTTKAVTK